MIFTRWRLRSLCRSTRKTSPASRKYRPVQMRRLTDCRSLTGEFSVLKDDPDGILYHLIDADERE